MTQPTTSAQNDTSPEAVLSPMNVVFHTRDAADQRYLTGAIDLSPASSRRPATTHSHHTHHHATATGGHLVSGYTARPDLDMTYRGGRTIADLHYANHYLGGDSAWDPADITAIDAALGRAMTDAGLNAVIAQYYPARPGLPPLTSAFDGSAVVPDPTGALSGAGARFYKDDVESLVVTLAASTTDAADTIHNLMLPRGVILVDGFSPGHPSAAHHTARRRGRPAVTIPGLRNDADVDSQHGLGGYHGSVPVTGGRVYYAVGVYSQGPNGIAVWPDSWKNVVATLYHELVEARTDPDVEDVIRGGAESLLGWYSDQAGEIGDIPVSTSASLSQVFVELDLSGVSTPVQLMWSNAVHGPAMP